MFIIRGVYLRVPNSVSTCQKHSFVTFLPQRNMPRLAVGDKYFIRHDPRTFRKEVEINESTVHFLWLESFFFCNNSSFFVFYAFVALQINTPQGAVRA